MLDLDLWIQVKRSLIKEALREFPEFSERYQAQLDLLRDLDCLLVTATPTLNSDHGHHVQTDHYPQMDNGDEGAFT